MPAVRVRYQTMEFGDADIHVRTLRDRQQFSDDDNVAAELGISSAIWPLFGIVWESGEILARIMHTHDIAGLKVLEVGCGIGLASLVLGSRHADITATDQHPEAAAFLAANVTLNGLAPIAFKRVDWDDDDPELGRFDLIIGSDLLYEEPSVALLSAFIDRHTRPGGKVIIVEPGRGLGARFTRRMVALQYRHDSTLAVDPAISTTYRGRVLRFSR